LVWPEAKNYKKKANVSCLTKHKKSTIISLLNIVTNMQSRLIRRQKKHNQTHATLFQKPFGVSDFLKQTPNQTKTPSTKMILYGSVVQTLARGSHDSFCATLERFLYAVYYTKS